MYRTAFQCIRFDTVFIFVINFLILSLRSHNFVSRRFVSVPADACVCACARREHSNDESKDIKCSSMSWTSLHSIDNFAAHAKNLVSLIQWNFEVSQYDRECERAPALKHSSNHSWQCYAISRSHRILVFRRIESKNSIEQRRMHTDSLQPNNVSII